MDYRKPILAAPREFQSGDAAFAIPQSLVNKNDEVALVLGYICNRALFGEGYCRLLPHYFDQMPKNSGVLISPFVPTNKILAHKTFPGDIDLLIIPFEGNELLLSKTLAIEFKIVRATFLKQGKSPNEFGFTQAEGLLELGFPYAAVAHLIISDQSPEAAWQEKHVVRVLDSNGRVSHPEPIMIDYMPADLINRAIGRLESRRDTNPNFNKLGLLASYISDHGNWTPSGSAAALNPKTSQDLLDAVANYYHRHPNRFLKTLRWPPE